MELKEQLQEALGSGYAVEHELEGGGMSRVFLARDTGLRRDVVAKVLKPDLLSGAGVERFEREIALVAALQHPHIVPLLSTGHLTPPAGTTGERLPYYLMPYVRGESLRARLSRGDPLGVREAVHILRDIASALAHAHAEGVVHRDIKPENVMLSGGVAVVMDFGVAKAVNAAATGTGASDGLTWQGVALGTPAYMSPEQAAADPQVDHRADIYAFGCVAYELLGGASPFGDRPPQQLLAAHLAETPQPLGEGRRTVPAGLAALVMRCLAKQPGDRPQSAAELLAALDAVATPTGGTLAVVLGLVAPRRWRRVLPVVGAALVLLAALIWWADRRRFLPYTLESARMVAATTDIEDSPAISPDGSLVAYVARSADAPAGTRQLRLRQVGGGGQVSFATEGVLGIPKWSPDGSSLLFFARSENGTGVAVYEGSYLGGRARQVLETLAPGGLTTSWFPDGRRFVLLRAGRFWIHHLDGGTPALVSVDSGQLRDPAVSPDGSRLAFVRGNVQRIGVLSVWSVSLSGGTPVRISDSTASAWCPVWAPDGRSLLFVANVESVLDIYQQRLSGTGAPIGAPTRITAGLGVRWFSLDRAGRRAAYSNSRTFAPLYSAPIRAAGMTLASEVRPVSGELEAAEWPDVSSDGKWIVYVSDAGGHSQIFKVPVEGGDPVQLTRETSAHFTPRWSPDGREIAYHTATRDGGREIRVMSADGRNDRPVTHEAGTYLQPSWAPSGAALVYAGLRPGADFSHLAITSRDPGGDWSPGRTIPGADTAGNPRWSPDGAWIAYQSARVVRIIAPSGGWPRSLDVPRVANGRVQNPVWSADSRTLFVSTTDGSRSVTYWAVPVSGGLPRKLLTLDAASDIFATDGSRLFFTRSNVESDIGLLEFRR